MSNIHLIFPDGRKKLGKETPTGKMEKLIQFFLNLLNFGQKTRGPRPAFSLPTQS